jgi:uncharacterized protein
MIVDFHAHLLEASWMPDRWWSWLVEYSNERRQGPLLNAQHAADVVNRYCDPGGAKLLRQMDDAKIDKTVVLPLDWGLLLGEPRVPIEEQHLAIAEIAARSEGRIVPFVGIDPRRKDAVRRIRFFLEEHDMRGIKLYPAAGYDPTADDFRPVFELAEAFHVPVLVHTGCSFGPFLTKYGEPSVMDCLCATYPGVTFVAAHLGSGFLEQFCWLGYAKPNLFVDCSLMQIRARRNYPEFARNLRLACDLIGSRRVLFGTDWPFGQSVMRNTDYTEAFGRLADVEDAGSGFAGYEIQQMLGGNAGYLLTKGE